jgi:hypothetical protein
MRLTTRCWISLSQQHQLLLAYFFRVGLIFSRYWPFFLSVQAGQLLRMHCLAYIAMSLNRLAAFKWWRHLASKLDLLDVDQ